MLLKLYFNITMLTEINLYGLIECNLSLTYLTQLGPKTWYMICFIKKKKTKSLCNLVFHLLQMYIKDPPSNAAKANKNFEKLTFGLSLINNMYCTVKV